MVRIETVFEQIEQHFVYHFKLVINKSFRKCWGTPVALAFFALDKTILTHELDWLIS